MNAVAERLREEAVDDPDAVDEEDGDAMPAPQVKVAADGSIILDEASTMIETTNYKKAKNDLIKAPLVFENANDVSKSILYKDFLKYRNFTIFFYKIHEK